VEVTAVRLEMCVKSLVSDADNFAEGDFHVICGAGNGAPLGQGQNDGTMPSHPYVHPPKERVPMECRDLAANG
jgi:hypothetical protein